MEPRASSWRASDQLALRRRFDAARLTGAPIRPPRPAGLLGPAAGVLHLPVPPSARVWIGRDGCAPSAGVRRVQGGRTTGAMMSRRALRRQLVLAANGGRVACVVTAPVLICRLEAVRWHGQVAGRTGDPSASSNLPARYDPPRGGEKIFLGEGHFGPVPAGPRSERLPSGNEQSRKLPRRRRHMAYPPPRLGRGALGRPDDLLQPGVVPGSCSVGESPRVCWIQPASPGVWRPKVMAPRSPVSSRHPNA